MTDILGLQGIEPDGTLIETADLIEIPARLLFSEPPACPTCDRQMTKNGVERVLVHDAPMRGKRVLIAVRKERRRCRPCKQQLTATSPDLRLGYRVLTNRLVRFVENGVVKTTVEDVARQVGLTPDLVTSLARNLDRKLRRRPSHWRTPDAIAVDNIQTARGARYQVLFDQVANRPMAVAPTWEFKPIRNEILRHLDVSRVRVFSSDMARVNFQIADVLTNAIHVADKFHVFQACNEGLRAVIAARVASLVEEARFAEAVSLKAAKAYLLGKETPGANTPSQLALQFEPLPPEIARYPDVAEAHEARVQLSRFYSSSGSVQARTELDEVYRLMKRPIIAEAMSSAMSYIQDHDRQVFAYFEALELMGTDLWSPHTTALERRNGMLQDVWREARGGLSIAMFRLRAIYQPYTFGLHIRECMSCGQFVGPADAQHVLALSQSPAPPPAFCCMCDDHFEATPDSGESIICSPESGVAATITSSASLPRMV